MKIRLFILFYFCNFYEIYIFTHINMRSICSNVRRIDSEMEILVLAQKFTIRIIEEGGGGWVGSSRCCGGCKPVQEDATSVASNDGGASILGTVEGGSDASCDGDPSQTCQALLELEKQARGKGDITSTRMEVCQEGGVAATNPNNLGNPFCDKDLVNGLGTGGLDEGCRGGLVESAGTGGKSHYKKIHFSLRQKSLGNVKSRCKRALPQQPKSRCRLLR
jgi:hypothetical protein